MTVRAEELESMRDAQVITYADACRIERRTQGDYDHATKSHPTVVETVVYEGPCDVASAVNLSPRELGEAERVVKRWFVSVPHDVVGAKEGDVVVITAARDPALPAELNLTFEASGGFATRRRYLCHEVTP